MIARFGTQSQKERYLPQMASGDLRAAFSMTEPHAGSDLQAIRTRARREGGAFVIDGQKMWVTNGLLAGIVMLLAVQDGVPNLPIAACPPSSWESSRALPPSPAWRSRRPSRSWATRASRQLSSPFDGFTTPLDSVLGGDAGENEGFKQFMAAIEVGRGERRGARRGRGQVRLRAGHPLCAGAKAFSASRSRTIG